MSGKTQFCINTEEFLKGRLIAGDGFPVEKPVDGYYTIENIVEVMDEFSKFSSIEFYEWMLDNNWQAVYSEELKKRAYVDAEKNPVLVHGSDYHFTMLIKEHGKTLEELYNLFLTKK